eukprot:9794957-Heterocapsa_arctica.AAC.1
MSRAPGPAVAGSRSSHSVSPHMAIGSLSRLLVPVRAEHAHSTFRWSSRPSIKSPRRRPGRRSSR